MKGADDPGPLDLLVDYGRRRPVVGLVLLATAALGAVLGVETLLFHVQLDPLADVRAYYEAGRRLNVGLPLYPAGADVDAADFYRYPPLLAVLFRPLALLPYGVAAAIWESLVLLAFGLTVRRLGLRRPATWLAVGVLARPIAWTLAIGQAQSLVTVFLAFGSPLAVALAANLKLFPALAALWWIGRRDWRSFRNFLVWMALLGLVQLVLAPAATIDFFRATGLAQVGDVANISPYAISPVLWIAMLGAGVLAFLRLAPTGWGWAAAMVLCVLAPPRLLTYMLSSLLAALREPDSARRAAGPAGGTGAVGPYPGGEPPVD